MGGKKATSTSQVTIPPEVLARYNAINARAESAASKPFQAFGSNPADYVAQMNEQQALGTSTVNKSGGPAYAGIDNYMTPYIKNVADTTGAYMRQQQEQAQSGALGTAASSGAFGGDRAGIAAANLQQQNQMAYGKTMADIMNQGYTQALGASQADLNRGLQAGQMQLAAGTMQQQTEQAGKDAMINRFMQEQGLPYQQAQFLANIALGTGAASGSTTTSTQPVGFFQNLATGGKVDGYAEGGGVAGPVSHSKEAIGGVGYVPEPNLPIGDLMIAQPPKEQDNDSSEKIAKIVASVMGAKNGGAIGGRNGYDAGGSPFLATAEDVERMKKNAGLAFSAFTKPDEFYPGPNSRSEAADKYWSLKSNPYDYAISQGEMPNKNLLPPSTGVVPPQQVAPKPPAAGKPTEYFIGSDLYTKSPSGAILDGYGNPVPYDLAENVRKEIDRQDFVSGSGVVAQTDKMAGQFRESQEALAQRNKDALVGMYGGNFPVSEKAQALGAAVVPPAPAISLGGLEGGARAEAQPVTLGAPAVQQAPIMTMADTAAPLSMGATLGSPAKDANLSTMGETGVVAPVGQTAPDYRRQVAKVLGGGKGYTDVEYTDGTRDRVVGNLNVRNNNPGNIEFGDLAQKYGAVGTDGRFAVFPDYETGRKAQEALLFESGVYSGKTIGSAIAKYAPAGDGNNNPAAYANSVAAALGVSVNTPLAALNPEQRSAMLTAMEKVEGGGGPSTYSTTPLDSSGAPIPLQNYGGGLAAGTFGNDKPYEDRNALGKFFYKPEGGLDRNSVLSALSGLGAMASSRSMSPFTAALQGLGAGADTYKGLLKQNADIGLINQQAGLTQSQSGLTQAQTAKTNIEAQTLRFFTVGAGGVPLVVLDGGGTATLAEYLSNPNLRASSNPEVEAQVRAAAEQRSTGGNGAMGLPVVSGYIDGEAAKATMNYPEATASSAAIYNGAEANAQAARSARASLLTQADAISQMVSPDANVRTGALANMQMEAIRYANAILSMAGQPTIDGPNDAQIATKMATLASVERASGAGQQSYEALNSILMANPNVALEPEANAKMMGNIMLSQQMSVDYAKFLREYQMDPNNTMKLVNDAPKAFYETYGRKYLAEEQALKTLIYKGSVKPAGSQESPMEFLMNPGYSAFDKNMVAKEFLAANGMNQEMMQALSDANGQIDIARVFGG